MWYETRRAVCLNSSRGRMKQNQSWCTIVWGSIAEQARAASGWVNLIMFNRIFLAQSNIWTGIILKSILKANNMARARIYCLWCMWVRENGWRSAYDWLTSCEYYVGEKLVEMRCKSSYEVKSMQSQCTVTMKDQIGKGKRLTLINYD